MEEEKKEGEEKTFFLNYKKYWKIQLSLLAIFLILFGIASYFTLGHQAAKLVRAGNYEEISRNSYGSKNTSFFKKIVNLFTSNEKIATQNTEEKTDSNSLIASNPNVPTSGVENSNKANNSYAEQEFANRNNSMSMTNSSLSKLSSSLSMGNVSKGNSGSSTSNNEINFAQESKNISLKTTTNKDGNSQNMKIKPGKFSAMEALKGAFKSSLYGARLSSQDAAKSWTAKAFDSSTTEEKSIQYDEKLKSKLDTLNPNAIPKFLKDQNPDMDTITSQTPPAEVGASEKDNGKEEEKNNAKQEMKKKLMQDMLSGVLNPLYGYNSNDSSSENSDSEDNTARAYNDPNSKGGYSNWHVDDYGYIDVKDENGITQIFDPNTGKILGCEDSNAGMCLMPGADNCPADAAIC
jgi:hypothetical protein